MNSNFKHDHSTEEVNSGIHSHKHEHSHTHEHEHVHEHEHAHEQADTHTHMDEAIYEMTEGISKDEKTLEILLGHWVDHNKSHEESYLEWMEKAKTMNLEQTSKCIEKAVEYMKMADEMLIEAKKHM